MSDKRSGVVRYESVDQQYLENRKLRKSADWVLLWALGVGAVISGDYFGWNYGLKHGFWGLAVATLLMAAMYVCMVFTIAELSAALPHAGGFFSFTRNAFGPTGGFICGLTDTIEYVLTPAVVVVGIGGYLNRLVFGADAEAHANFEFLWWFLSYAMFVAINIRGVELTLKVGLVITLLAVAVLVIFYVSAFATGSFDRELLFNLPVASEDSNSRLSAGAWSVFAALPFAIWFYLAIEQLPLAAEESHDAANDMPKALILGIATLLVLSLLTLVINPGVGGGAAQIAVSDAPLADGFQAVFGIGAASWLLILISLTGLVASFHTIIYAYGRVLFALSRAGYFPRWISLTGKSQTPHVALLLGAAIGMACAVLIHFFERGAVGGALLNMAVFGAVISYALVMFSYIKLRISRPDLPRPYRSPLGIPGAAVGAALSIVALLATFAVKDYRPAVWGTALFVAAGIIYFLAYSRHHLVAQAPEEENALIAEAESKLAHQ
jgi:ethanolamine permease